MNYKEGHHVHMIKTAITTAKRYHMDQTRKYTGEDYYDHLKSVADKVTEWGFDNAHMICAAYLHDIVEDQKFCLETIKAHWGFETYQYVWYLTNVPHAAGNRAKRHKMDVERLSQAPWQAKVIKCADLIDNTSTIVKHDPNFAKIYLDEKKEIVSKFVEDFDIPNHVIKELVEVLENAIKELEEVQNR